MFNRAACIVNALHSILTQTLCPAQLIVVDNASTDNSKAVVEQWMKQQNTPCQLLLLSESTPGAAAARNRGLQAVTTTWVSFFDSDDVMSPNFLEQMLHCAAQQGKQWVVTRSMMVFPTSNSATNARALPRWGKPNPTLTDQILGACISTQTFVAQTVLVQRIGGWNAHLSIWDDYEIGLRLLLADPHPAWCAELFHQIVQHPNSLTGNDYCSRAKAITTALTSLAQQLQGAGHLALEQRQKALLALHYRTQLVAGQLTREGDNAAAQQLFHTLQPLLPPLHSLHRLAAGLLRHYVQNGGRGAWRVARFLVDSHGWLTDFTNTP